MSGEIQVDYCEVCGELGPVQRTTFYYGIKCECHSPEHFELVLHCKKCIPKEPLFTKITVRTEVLKQLKI